MKKLNRSLWAVLAGLMLFSCNYARFDRAPGTSLQEIPEKYRGKFFAKASDKKMNDGDDTAYVEIGKDYYREYGLEPSKSKDKRVLGKDFLFNSSKGIDYLAVQSDEDSLFTLFVLEPSKKGFVMTVLEDYSQEQRAENKNLKGKFSKYFSEKCKTGFAGANTWYYVMDENKLHKAYRKKIRKMPGIDFIRIQ